MAYVLIAGSLIYYNRDMFYSNRYPPYYKIDMLKFRDILFKKLENIKDGSIEINILGDEKKVDLGGGDYYEMQHKNVIIVKTNSINGLINLRNALIQSSREITKDPKIKLECVILDESGSGKNNFVEYTDPMEFPLFIFDNLNVLNINRPNRKFLIGEFDFHDIFILFMDEDVEISKSLLKEIDDNKKFDIHKDVDYNNTGSNKLFIILDNKKEK